MCAYYNVQICVTVFQTDAEKEKYMGAVLKPSSRSIERIDLPMDRAFPATVIRIK
jgi:hypothetical protein